jgi:predicted nucleotidyltransferase
MFEKIELLRLFFTNPTKEYGVREVAKLLKIAPATASTKLRELNKQKLLSHRKERVYDLYKAAVQSPLYTNAKRYDTIERIHASGLFAAIEKQYNKPVLVLFGSAAHGLDTENSDIDLLILSENTAPFPEQKRYEKALGRPLQLFVKRSLKELGNEHLVTSVINGIVLAGELQWT